MHCLLARSRYDGVLCKSMQSQPIPKENWYYRLSPNSQVGPVSISMIFLACVERQIDQHTPVYHAIFGSTTLNQLPHIIHAFRLHVVKCKAYSFEYSLSVCFPHAFHQYAANNIQLMDKKAIRIFPRFRCLPYLVNRPVLSNLNPFNIMIPPHLIRQIIISHPI